MSMPRRAFLPSVLSAAVLILPTVGVRAQEAFAPLDAAALLRMDEARLQEVYRGGAVAGLPSGRTRGTVLPAPGTRRNAAMSAAARLVWQGKEVDPAGTTAVNRFFGVRSVAGRLYQGQSWLDGGPTLVLDYAGSSRVYANKRDEIRLIAPGLYLGIMHDRSTNPPTVDLYFVLETTP